MATIMLPKGHKYRFAFHPTVNKGKLYIGVKCHSCQGDIYLTEANDQKAPTLPLFVGEGHISAPCDACGHDDLYTAGEVRLLKSNKNIKSFRDLRPNPSNSSRQRLFRRYPSANSTFGVGSLEYRPECAKAIARCITYWTYVECELARLLSVLLKARTEPAMAVFLSLRNARTKTEALDAAASHTLDDKDYEIFCALMQYKDSVEKQRNDIVHGVFGVSSDIKNGLAWISSTEFVSHLSRGFNLGPSIEENEAFKKKQFVYELGDIETIARDIEHLRDQISFFLGYLYSEDMAWRASRYPQLCNEPRLAKELSLLRQRRKNNQEDDPQ
ncbi:MAG: hypothetical protein ACR65U_08040 [Methylocystis sp.]